MRRREFVRLFGSAAVACRAVAAQGAEQPKRVGLLTNLAEDDPETRSRLDAFLAALRQLGWRDGSNLKIEYRWGVGDSDNHRKNAAELVALRPDVIVAHGSTIMGPLQRATKTIPIVFVSVSDPVAGGFASSLGRPGGNSTGFTTFEYGQSAKWLEVLKEIVPDLKWVAVIRDPEQVSGGGQLGALQAAASFLKVELNPIGTRDMSEIDRIRRWFRGAAEGRVNRHHRCLGANPPGRIGWTCSTTSAARDVPLPHFRESGWPVVLHARHHRSISPGGHLRRSNSKR
jgi:ABC-type uncharacterized transport system substrate-binding protein